ncbi:alpha/beta fold hydrolase [Cognaticolwellia mytili]|uniref:alpha/beta fold hydrolase n=1 Tax=Cognaticolwellia mytili TaxID=1888913 RepID=UPI000A16EF16|nr:alpha/beta hydrolase [Cognaticolwellia mytili]
MLSDGIKEIAFNLGSKKIAALTNGNDQAPLLLCLHGWLDNAASFQPLMPYLADYHVIAIDWPGHGFSSHRSEDAHYHFIDWIYDLVQLFKLQQWSNVNIVAHSMGGMIASAFVAAFPERVKSLSLIDSIGLLALNSEKTTTQLRKGMLSRLSRRDSSIRYHPSIASAIEARTLVSDLSEKNAQLIVNRGLEATELGYKWRSDSRLRSTSPYRFTLPQAQQIITDVKLPTQLLYGNKGMDMVTVGLKDFRKLFQSLEVHELVGGHHVHMEQPELMAKLIIKFVN